MLVGRDERLPFDDQRCVEQDDDRGRRSVRQSISGVWSEEEDNETLKWRECFKNFERCKKRKRQRIIVVDKSTCRLIGGVGEMSNQ